MTNNHKYKASVGRKSEQNGSVLLWGLVILLTLTVVGVAAARMGITDIRIAGNQVFGAMTYQSAESVLQKVSKDGPDRDPLYYIEATDSSETSWPFVETVNDGGTVNATVDIKMAGSIQCAPQEGFAVSAEMLSDTGGVSCLLYTMDSRASLAGTGARSNHAQGVMKYVPSSGKTVE